MKPIRIVPSALAAALVFSSIAGPAAPVLQLRLRAPDITSDAAWASTRGIISEIGAWNGGYLEFLP